MSINILRRRYLGAEREEEARTEESEEDAGNVTGGDKTEDETEDESMYEGGVEDSFHSAGFPGIQL